MTSRFNSLQSVMTTRRRGVPLLAALFALLFMFSEAPAAEPGTWPSTSVSYGYDAEGNALPSGSGHAYDAASDLVQTGSGRSNLYDGNHLRVRTSEAGVTTYEFRSVTGALLAQWRKQAGYYDRLKEHINVAGKELAEQQTDFLGATQQPVSWLFLQPDTLGSPLTSTWAGGGLLFKENYQPYGTQLNGTAAGYTTGTFGGLRQDSADLAYAGRRYYDPRIGRFLAIDPVEFQEDHLHSFNRYAYANNNPNKFKDPQGRFPVLALLPPALEGLMAWAGSSAGAAAVGTAAGVGLGVMLNANSQADSTAPPADGAATSDRPPGPDGKRGSTGGPGSGKRSPAESPEDRASKEGVPCRYCGRPTTNTPGQPNSRERDHIDPKSRGGNNSSDNEGDSCRTCNREKSSRNPDEWVPSRTEPKRD